MYRLSLLLIGAGDICNKHLESLSKISKINLFGIYSRTQSKAQLLANKYKIKKVFSSFDQVKVNLMHIDAIFILVNADQTIKVFNKVKIYNKILFFEKEPSSICHIKYHLRCFFFLIRPKFCALLRDVGS